MLKHFIGIIIILSNLESGNWNTYIVAAVRHQVSGSMNSVREKNGGQQFSTDGDGLGGQSISL